VKGNGLIDLDVFELVLTCWFSFLPSSRLHVARLALYTVSSCRMTPPSRCIPSMGC
jgi:hypothetical protein